MPFRRVHLHDVITDFAEYSEFFDKTPKSSDPKQTDSDTVSSSPSSSGLFEGLYSVVAMKFAYLLLFYTPTLLYSPFAFHSLDLFLLIANFDLSGELRRARQRRVGEPVHGRGVLVGRENGTRVRSHGLRRQASAHHQRVVSGARDVPVREICGPSEHPQRAGYGAGLGSRTERGGLGRATCILLLEWR